MQRTSSLFTILLVFVFGTLAHAQLNDAVKFRITDPNGYSDEMIVRFENAATPVYDTEWDAWKWFSMNPAVPSIYSWTTDPYEMAVNSIPFPTRDTTMAIMMNAYETSGTYTFEALFEGTFTSDLKIGIEDLLTGQRYLIGSGLSFLFDVVAGPDEMERFSFYVSPVTRLGVDENNVNVINDGAVNWNCALFSEGGTALTSLDVPADSISLTTLANDNYMLLSTDAFGFVDTLYFTIAVENEEEPNTASLNDEQDAAIKVIYSGGLISITGAGMPANATEIYFFAINGAEICPSVQTGARSFQLELDASDFPSMIVVVIISGDRKYDYKMVLP